jgi:hypothetical protein
LLNDAEVNIGDPPLDSFDYHVEEPAVEEAGVEEEEEEDEDVTEIGEEMFEAGGGARRPIRTANYTEVEDVLLVKAWSQVGLHAVTGTDQTGKRYWQRIKDRYCMLKTQDCHIESSFLPIASRPVGLDEARLCSLECGYGSSEGSTPKWLC